MSSRAQKLLLEAKRRNAFTAAVDATSAGLFKQQRAAFDSKSKRVVLKAGRRSGKTQTVLPIVLRAAARFPGSLIPVLERTLACNAAKAFWKNLQAFDSKYELGIEFRHTVKEATLPNGTRIQVYGVDTLELADKLRGEGFPIAVVDEAGTFRSHVLEYLISEAVNPGLMDYDGQLYLAGTPAPRREGYWFDRCHDESYEQHHWTVLDNTEYGQLPYQRSLAWRQEALKELILAEGFLEPKEKWLDVDPATVIAACQHPKFLREYMGLWIDHVEELMYEFHPDRNIIHRLPEAEYSRPWRYGMGIDLGYNDPTAFTITATRERDPYVYVVESMERREMIPSTIAAQIERYKMAYGYFHFIVGDTGGSGKLAVEEMNRKYGCGIIPAQKTAKLVYVDHLNGDFRTGRVQVVKSTNEDLISNLWALPWNDKHTDAHTDFDDHLPDSLLYNHRQWNVARVGWEFEAPVIGSPKWVAAMEELEEVRGDDLQRQLETFERAEESFDFDLDYGD